MVTVNPVATSVMNTSKVALPAVRGSLKATDIPTTDPDLSMTTGNAVPVSLPAYRCIFVDAVLTPRSFLPKPVMRLKLDPADPVGPDGPLAPLAPSRPLRPPGPL